MQNLCYGIRIPDIYLKGLRKTRKNLGGSWSLVRMEPGKSLTEQTCRVQCVTEEIFFVFIMQHLGI
jgi:hypothetical protein